MCINASKPYEDTWPVSLFLAFGIICRCVLAVCCFPYAEKTIPECWASFPLISFEYRSWLFSYGIVNLVLMVAMAFSCVIFIVSGGYMGGFWFVIIGSLHTVFSMAFFILNTIFLFQEDAWTTCSDESFYRFGFALWILFVAESLGDLVFRKMRQWNDVDNGKFPLLWNFCME